MRIKPVRSINYDRRKPSSHCNNLHGIQLQYNELHTNDLIQQYRIKHVATNVQLEYSDEI